MVEQLHFPDDLPERVIDLEDDWEGLYEAEIEVEVEISNHGRVKARFKRLGTAWRPVILAIAALIAICIVARQPAPPLAYLAISLVAWTALERLNSSSNDAESKDRRTIPAAPGCLAAGQGAARPPP